MCCTQRAGGAAKGGPTAPKVDHLSEAELIKLKEQAQQNMLDATKAAAAAMANATKLAAAHQDLLTPLSPLNMSGEQLISPRKGAAAEEADAAAPEAVAEAAAPAADPVEGEPVA